MTERPKWERVADDTERLAIQASSFPFAKT